MHQSFEFFQHILDSLSESIVVIDLEGTILYVNQSWVSFGQNNACSIKGSWETINYLTICDQAAAQGDAFGAEAAGGIRAVIAKEKQDFYYEYPCHSDTEQRWFMMRVTPLAFNDRSYFVITHHNITQRILAEQKALNLSRIDGLTNIPNRRYFNEFLNDEWKRSIRSKTPLTLALIDIDHFKEFNDSYGHLAGDNCLMVIASTLQLYARRPSDLCARYGGEEFALVFGNTSTDMALAQLQQLKDAIALLDIPNDKSPTALSVTVSIGIATLRPTLASTTDALIKNADEQLYRAKAEGRNRICYVGDA